LIPESGLLAGGDKTMATFGLAPDAFEPVEHGEFNKDNISPLTSTPTMSISYRRDAWRRLRQEPLAMIGLFVLIFFCVIAVFGPFLCPYSYSEINWNTINQAPSVKHWFGTDNLGRDIFARVVYGLRITLTVGMLSALISLALGVVYGGISGLAGGWLDNIMMRIVDILYSIPPLIYVILLMVLLEPGLKNVIIVLGVTLWLDMARIVRGQILSLKEQDYILAARSMGTDSFGILVKHLLPNTRGPILVTLVSSVQNGIFSETFLSFIGLGITAPMASLGVLASEGLITLAIHPWQLGFSALVISVCILALNFLGNGLQSALEPRMRK
jgi:oligopeptide transport system permease protein